MGRMEQELSTVRPLGFWLKIERCRNPDVSLDEKDGRLCIGGIALSDRDGEFRRDNTFWFKVVDVGPKCGKFRYPIPPDGKLVPGRTYLPRGGTNTAYHYGEGDLVLCPNKHETAIRRVGDNVAFIDCSLPYAVLQAGDPAITETTNG